MCLSQYVQSKKWNWAGDVIIHSPVVPSHRPAPKQHGRQHAGSYKIDPREFLVTENNAVMHACLTRDIVASCAEPARLERKDRGDFDYRADTIARWVAKHIALTKDRDDIWLFPDETLHVKAGDCEDRAVLLAALLVASGISAYNVRVAVGAMVFRHGDKIVKRCQHAWVVYRRENGEWEIKEPVGVNKRAARRPSAQLLRLQAAKISYEPAFVWNGDHVWQVYGGDAETWNMMKVRSKWRRLSPEFSGDVHRTLIHDALGGYGNEVVDELQRSFTYLFGNYIDWPDMPSRYDPRDHFDNCCIRSSWGRVAERLHAFAGGDLRAFGLAAHAIGDFYSHTSYPVFANRQTTGNRSHYPRFDPAWLAAGQLDGNLANPARYDTAPFDLTGPGFTRGPRWGDRDAATAAAEWRGKILSGRYAHEGDSKTFFERFTWMPEEVWDDPQFWRCAGAPHHEEMAVDSAQGKNSICTATDFPDEFERRYASAVLHVRHEFEQVRGPSPAPHPY